MLSISIDNKSIGYSSFIRECVKIFLDGLGAGYSGIIESLLLNIFYSCKVGLLVAV